MSMPFHLLRLSARPRWLLLLLALLLLAATIQPNALAHALLVRSQPAANAELTAAPPSVEMWFSEPLESRFSHARLIDSAGEDVQSAGLCRRPSRSDSPEPAPGRLIRASTQSFGPPFPLWTAMSGSVLFPSHCSARTAADPPGDCCRRHRETGEIPAAERYGPLAFSAGHYPLAGGMLFRKIVATLYWPANPCPRWPVI